MGKKKKILGNCVIVAKAICDKCEKGIFGAIISVPDLGKIPFFSEETMNWENEKRYHPECAPSPSVKRVYRCKLHDREIGIDFPSLQEEHRRLGGYCRSNSDGNYCSKCGDIIILDIPE